jgi:hypothetical protein
MTLKEFRRQENVVDTMLSGHTWLAERYERRSTAITLVIMAASIVGTGAAFISGEPSASIGPFSARVQVWVGVLTCLIFFLSIVELKVEWSRRAWAHEEAARRLADLKPKYRQASIEGGVVTSDTDLTTEYNRTMEMLGVLRVRIPEGQFNKVKARHWRKVELSRRISARPQRPRLLHRLDIVREGLNRGAPESRHESLGPDERP